MNKYTPVNLAKYDSYYKFRTDENIAVIGLGYVGLPVGIGFAKHFKNVVGFDICSQRISELESNNDCTGEIASDELKGSKLNLTTDVAKLSDITFFIVTVPTPIDQSNRPDLSPLKTACQIVGPYLKNGSVVVFESTVYPGVTEDICGPTLESASGLRSGLDFKLAYSPERINPGDKAHRLENIIKVVGAQDQKTLERVSKVYETLVHAGVHRAPNIRVAEAAKVIENTQRDVNIALMNEIAMICDRLGINSHEVREAANTKWNFLPFTPGLVGGHCIGVDPYYLTAKAEEVGYNSEVILSGRRVNDGMGDFIAAKAIKMLAAINVPLSKAKVGVLGLTFKENVPDLRNSKTFDILNGFAEYGIQPLIHDPLVKRSEIPSGPYSWIDIERMPKLDLLVVAVPHEKYLEKGAPHLINLLHKSGAIIDVRSALNREKIPETLNYWNL